MVRPPNPQSKTLNLILRGKDGEADKIRAVKAICARNNITISSVLMRYGVDYFLKLHHWPPGNSQTVMESYSVQQKHACYLCHDLQPNLVKVEFISGLQRSICPACLRKDQEGKGLVRRSLL